MGFTLEHKLFYYAWEGRLVFWAETELESERAIFENVLTGERTVVYYHSEIIRELNEMEVIAWAAE